MITIMERDEGRKLAAELIRAAGIPVSLAEESAIEVTDFGLSRPSVEGAQILTWVQTERIGVKVIALLPGQTLPEHWHPRIGDDPGKEETVRHVAGDLFVFTNGPTLMQRGHIPDGKERFYTSLHESVLVPGDQMTFPPLTRHWFQAGPAGAVAYSFSTVVHDALDGFTDPGVQRVTILEE